MDLYWFLVAAPSFFFSLFIIFRVLIFGIDTPGYASMIVAVTFFGGLQLIGIGVLGEYLGRAYIETKRRPVFLTRKIYKVE
jgi:glycosyltransferase involved in cell wall biosynthesis